MFCKLIVIVHVHLGEKAAAGACWLNLTDGFLNHAAIMLHVIGIVVGGTQLSFWYECAV